VTLISSVEEFFRGEPVFGPDSQDLVTMLKSPAVAAPTSLQGQLDYIRTRWGSLLEDLLLRLLTGIDILKEETTMRFGAFAPAPPEVLEYAGQAGEREAFSPDRDWMPRVVMMAKNALVWLDQLSRRYSREIRRLDQVPDEELDRLASAGFTALWLIGVWERSGASREIKRRMGNTEAEASAYSLDDYRIAGELGGEDALNGLRERAWRRGIRLASDMVPNHTGVDSAWMRDHPDRFLTWPHPWPPFPSYSFNGPDVSRTPGIGVYLEDHYWDRTDAAVVFKRVNFSTGESRLIYHGNDGTHMPWNDTAQLNFLNPETREAVIQTILHVARMFPIIRFDAAMTLAKKHYQRLWFPEPGHGGDIPSRAGNGLSRHDFDRAMPQEFWREVVDRIAREAPETLLLAEAFWMLEGFFVRTLGMHRVYNSAFMHMLMKEDNAGYRRTIRNTLEFDPQVLKRFVNFMSNPDEQTAIEQFGDGDKYLGVCTLMATLPGLPMFAHGQVEG
ncbi:MAG TPA: alpha-amylase family glycosyl hydrolase, partial [Spirochaetia bacterium]|nr:alpha-amylase family glycosyl hydrolase [Spirochaetia bacterium]